MSGFDNRFTLPLFGMSNLKTGTMSPLSPKVTKQIHSRSSYNQYHQEDLREEILINEMEVSQETNDTSGKSASNEKDEKPSFGARPNTKDPDFDFKKELEPLPFELNIGDAPLTRDQQARLIDCDL